MERIQSINPGRVEWCCEERGITPQELAEQLSIATARFKSVMAGEDGLTFNQLRKVADYFNRGALFFLEPGPVDARRVHSPDFRTLSNQKPDLSPKVLDLIERVERHRELFLSLLEDLGEVDAPGFDPPDIPTDDATKAAAIARRWLGLDDERDFEQYRSAVAARGILVFRSSGFAGDWQIPRDSPICGFSLYDSRCPVILVRRLRPETRQTFTLMHEVGHVLLHERSFIDDEEDLYLYQGRERDANRFAGHLLVPDEKLANILDTERPNDVADYDEWLRPYKDRWGVSGEVILRRLLDTRRLPQQMYADYRHLPRGQSDRPEGGNRKYRHREPTHLFGEGFVRLVFAALHANQLTLARASTHLDNLKIRDVHALEEHLADI